MNSYLSNIWYSRNICATTYLTAGSSKRQECKMAGFCKMEAQALNNVSIGHLSRISGNRYDTNMYWIDT